ncbi:MAG TPA: hypothetical protein VFZ52_08690 [Chryseolinea sp.]
MMNFLNNNLRSLVHVSLKEVLENIYNMLTRRSMHKPFYADSFVINGGPESTPPVAFLHSKPTKGHRFKNVVAMPRRIDLP